MLSLSLSLSALTLLCVSHVGLARSAEACMRLSRSSKGTKRVKLCGPRPMITPLEATGPWCLSVRHRYNLGEKEGGGGRGLSAGCLLAGGWDCC